MVGPHGFGALWQLFALIILLGYCQNPWPAVMIAVGLVLFLYPPRLLGLALAVPLLRTNHQKYTCLHAAPRSRACVGMSFPF